MWHMRWHPSPCLMVLLVALSVPLLLLHLAAAQQPLQQELSLSKEGYQPIAEGLLKSWRFAQFMDVAGAPCKGCCSRVAAELLWDHSEKVSTRTDTAGLLILGVGLGIAFR